MMALGQHRLRRFQLVNWGTFDHYVDLPVPRSGLLITGESGSGKSSLLDAMAAVLVQPGKLKLNAAAQEGASGDRARSLLTYVRGAYKREADEASGEVLTAYLRPGAAWSGICLTYDDGLGKITSLVRLLHAASSASAGRDVRSLFAVAEGDVDLVALEPYAIHGLDMRHLKLAYPQWTVVSDYSGFAQKMQRSFGLENDQAQLLLHKTQSAKNLTSLDVLLRDFMLDPPETFDRAEQAIEQFNELSAAHSSVVDARRQTEVLEKLEQQAAQRKLDIEESKGLEEQRIHLESYTLQRSLAVLQDALDKLSGRITAFDAEIAQAIEVLATRREQQKSAQRKVDGLGGRELEVLEREHGIILRQLDDVKAKKASYAGMAQASGLELPEQDAQVEAFLEKVALLRHQAQETDDKRDARFSRTALAAQAKDARELLEKQLLTLRTQRCALDERLLVLRGQLAQAAQVDIARLGFAGELIRVLPEQAKWTGAIERVLRGFAQTLLVPDELYPLVSDYVDQRHLGQRLVYLRVPDSAPDAPEPKDERSLVHKVAVDEGEFSEWLRCEMARRFDYVCVESAAELRGVKRGVTLRGQVKHSQTRHEKDDRSKVDDPSRWVLGSSLEMRRAALETELQRLIADEAQAVKTRDAMEREYLEQQGLIQRLDSLSTLEWSDIDDASPAGELDRIQAQIEVFNQGKGGLAEAQTQLKRAEDAAAGAEAKLNGLRDKRSRAGQEYESKQAERQSSQDRVDALGPIPPTVEARLTERFMRAGDIGADAASRQLRRDIEFESQRAANNLRKVEGSCTALMSGYKKDWPGPAADLASDIEYLDEYMVILDDLRTDRLPEFEGRFFDLLQRQSRNNIGELALIITRSRQEIRARVDPINRSLLQTEYAPGQHLRLQVIDVQSREVQEFLEDLNSIATGSLEDSMVLEPSPEQRAQAEERYKKLEALLKRMDPSDPANQNWRRQCLDTRLHVRFRADVVDAQSQQTNNVFTDAGGLSGGERQKLVVFCLAAALRYQLAREGSEVPSYGLVILDEAFDKTDPAFTRAGLDVFSSFGFQLLLATPLKMLQTLESYVGGAVQISNREGQGSRCEKLIWELGDEGDGAGAGAAGAAGAAGGAGAGGRASAGGAAGAGGAGGTATTGDVPAGETASMFSNMDNRDTQDHAQP